ncbi:MAG: type II secretion system F family protein [Gammaproteobacteria bacterium]
MMELLTTASAWVDANLITAIGVTVFAAVVSLTLAVTNFVARESTLRRRAFQPYMVGNADILKDRRALDHRDTLNAAKMLGRAAARFVPGDSNKPGGLRHQMRVAGLFSAQAIGTYYLCRLALGFALPIAVLVFYPYFLPTSPFLQTLAIAIGVGVVGYYIPSVWLDRRIRVIRVSHRQGFPEMLDLLVVCTEAGIGIEAAIDRVGRELTQLYPHLATQIHLLNLELRAGRSLTDALERFADNLGIEEARSFSTLIQQSQELGTSLVDALRVYSDEMRDKRLARAEEKAHALPAKLVLPLGFFIFPVMLVVTMLPVVLRLSLVFAS